MVQREGLWVQGFGFRVRECPRGGPSIDRDPYGGGGTRFRTHDMCHEREQRSSVPTGGGRGGKEGRAGHPPD